MIYINISNMEFPNGWIEEAEKKTEELTKLPEDQRKEFIKNNSKIWQSLKHNLEILSHNKCWYCEIRNTRSDHHVEHYRPKNRITNDDGSIENGYWWLAFDYTNFRIACSYCNCLHRGVDDVTRGKADKFPLLERSSRALPSTDPADERPILLDPTNPVDPPLLTFLDDGRASPIIPEISDILYHRAEMTINILNLNDRKIVDARKVIKEMCKRIIRRGDRAFRLLKEDSVTGKEQFKQVIIEAKEMINVTSELSSAARSYILGSGEVWITQFIR